MLDLKFIRENPDVVRWAIQVKNIILDFDKLLALDAEVRSTRHKSELLAAQRRRLADQFRSPPLPRQRAVSSAAAFRTPAPVPVVRPSMGPASEKLNTC